MVKEKVKEKFKTVELNDESSDDELIEWKSSFCDVHLFGEPIKDTNNYYKKVCKTCGFVLRYETI